MWPRGPWQGTNPCLARQITTITDNKHGLFSNNMYIYPQNWEHESQELPYLYLSPHLSFPVFPIISLSKEQKAMLETWFQYMFWIYRLHHHSQFGSWLASYSIFIPVFQVMEMNQTACNCSAAIGINRMGIIQEDEAMFSWNSNIIITAKKEQIECMHFRQTDALVICLAPGKCYKLNYSNHKLPQMCSDL